jgi:hypothetical protein
VDSAALSAIWRQVGRYLACDPCPFNGEIAIITLHFAELDN